MDICVIGDSITYGEGDIDQGGWAHRLRLSIEQSIAREGIIPTIYNLGVLGDTTEDCLRRIECELSAREPSLVLLAIGINDSAYRENKSDNIIPLSRFSENIEKLIGISREFTENIGFIGLTRVNEALVKPLPRSTKRKSFANDVIETYDNKIKEICSAEGVPYIEMTNALADEDLTDGLHPNTNGYKKMFDRIHPVVERMIKEQEVMYE